MRKPRHYKQGFWLKRVNGYCEVQLAGGFGCELDDYKRGFEGKTFICRVDYSSIGMYARSSWGQHTPLGIYLVPLGKSKDEYMQPQKYYLDKHPRKTYSGEDVVPDPYISRYEAMFIRDISIEEMEVIRHGEKVMQKAKRKMELV